ncbi:putative calcium-transporting ATPase 2 [Cadophora sp. MPI-SDFR-AT-0126]|nr:putative calcium-transporting ATPase 2 [Leotiomycetes sp. MPI-SDFR-AT-0126]
MSSRASHDTSREQRTGESRSSTPANSTRGYARDGASFEIDAKEAREARTPFNLIDSRGALSPDPGKEADFEVEDNKFAFSPGQLNKLYNPKSLAAFVALGGLAGLEKGLRTDRNSGLSIDEHILDGRVTFEDATANIAVRHCSPESADDRTTHPPSDPSYSTGPFSDRIRIFSDGRVPPRRRRNLFRCVIRRFENRAFAYLLALLSFVYLSIRLTDHSVELKSYGTEWQQVVILLSLYIVYLFLGGLIEWKRDGDYTKLCLKRRDAQTRVVRSGKAVLIPKFDVLVGDIVLFEPGDIIPADGILVSGHHATFDEACCTGEADLMRKIPADEAMAQIEARALSARNDPFVLSGSIVVAGMGSFIATSVGVHSGQGKIEMSLRDDPDDSPLQIELVRVCDSIIKLGSALVLVLFVVLFIRFLIQLGSKEATHLSSMQKTRGFLRLSILCLSLVIVCCSSSLLYSASFALAYTSRALLRDNNLVLTPKSCETIASTTTICTSMTGVLTQNKMTVVAGALGESLMFDCRPGGLASEDNGIRHTLDLITDLHSDSKRLLKDLIVLNSTAFDGEVDGVHSFIGSKTETALLQFARDHLAMDRCSYERASVDVVDFIPFDSNLGYSAIAINLNKSEVRIYAKGSTETIIEKSTQVWTGNMNQGISTNPVTSSISDLLRMQSDTFSSEGLRTVGLGYKTVAEFKPRSSRGVPGSLDDIGDLVYIGTFGIQDPLRHSVTDTVRSLQAGGVVVRMMTGNNLLTAKAVAEQSGVLKPDGVFMTGKQFRQLATAEQRQVAPRLQVLAACTSGDKRILVQILKKLGENVAAVTGHYQDGPALKAASIGISLGIHGSQVASEASNVILMDDDFRSVFKYVHRGRVLRRGIENNLKFWISSIVTSFITTVSIFAVSNDKISTFMPSQLLWINLLINCLAAVALLTDHPSRYADIELNEKPFARMPYERTPFERRNVDIESRRRWSPDPLMGRSALLSMTMIKEIAERVLCQVAALLLCRYAGQSIFGMKTLPTLAHVSSTVFNMFVWMQILSLFSNHPRRVGIQTFKILSRNLWFSAVIFIVGLAQTLLMFYGGTAFNLRRLNGVQWAISVGAAFFVSFGIAIIVGTIRWLWRRIKEIDLSSIKGFSITESIASNRRSGIRETTAGAFAAILSASIAGSVAGLPVTTHRFQRNISINHVSRLRIFAWTPIPLIFEQMRLTFYTIFVNGFRIEALADTGASVNLVAKSYVQRDPAAWQVVPQSCRLRLGDGKTCRSSGYIRTSIRFDNSEELHPTTLYIINGLPYDVALSHDFLSTTSTVQFSRPGGITRESTYPVGPSQPANAVILTHLVAVRQKSIFDRAKRCFGWDRRPPPAAPEDASTVLDALNLRRGEIDERRLFLSTNGPLSTSAFGSPARGSSSPQSPPPLYLAQTP